MAKLVLKRYYFVHGFQVFFLFSVLLNYVLIDLNNVTFAAFLSCFCFSFSVFS